MTQNMSMPYTSSPGKARLTSYRGQSRYCLWKAVKGDAMDDEEIEILYARYEVRRGAPMCISAGGSVILHKGG